MKLLNSCVLHFFPEDVVSDSLLGFFFSPLLLQPVTRTKQLYQLGSGIVFLPPVKVALLLRYSVFPHYSSLITAIIGLERLGVSTMQWFI